MFCHPLGNLCLLRLCCLYNLFLSHVDFFIETRDKSTRRMMNMRYFIHFYTKVKVVVFQVLPHVMLFIY